MCKMKYCGSIPGGDEHVLEQELWKESIIISTINNELLFYISKRILLLNEQKWNYHATKSLYCCFLVTRWRQLTEKSSSGMLMLKHLLMVSLTNCEIWVKTTTYRARWECCWKMFFRLCWTKMNLLTLVIDGGVSGPSLWVQWGGRGKEVLP